MHRLRGDDLTGSRLSGTMSLADRLPAFTADLFGMACRIMLSAALVAGALALRPLAAAADDVPVEIEAPRILLTNIPFTVTLTASEDFFAGQPDSMVTLRIDGVERTARFDADRTAQFEDLRVEGGRHEVHAVADGQVIAQLERRAVPAWLAIVPALLAIGMALAFRQVIAALFLGIWIGAFIIHGLTIPAVWFGLRDALGVHVVSALTNPDYVAILIFSFMIGGMVGIISKNGGMMGVVNIVVKWARDARRGQLSTSFLGLAIFFDDYANTLVVGNTMRGITDTLRISREKLAYLVDSTAAPIACIAFVTTWIGFQVGLIGDAVAQIEGFDQGAYSVFLNSLPYAFYPILAIVFVLLVAGTGRDFGSMYRAEVRARTTGELFRPDADVANAEIENAAMEAARDKPHRAVNAIVPVVVLVGGTMVGLYVTGEGETLWDIIGDADPYAAMMGASLVSVLIAVVMSVGQRILSLGDAIDAWYAGVKTMLFAIIILILAWALSDVNTALNTAGFLVSVLGERLEPGLVPAIVFVLAAFTSFATGTSWGTMGILMPLVLPLAWAVLAADGIHTEAEYYHIIYSSASAVLAGSVWGDHCSPIADTTILSSMASGCDHIDHVRTQLPYALLVGFVALFIGTLPTGFGFPWWISMILGIAILSAVLMRYGKKADQAELSPLRTEHAEPLKD